MTDFIISDPNTEWEISCSPEHFSAIRNDEKFKLILTLSRIVNTIQFAQVSGIDAIDTEGHPATNRQQMASFLYLASILYEGYEFSKKLGKYYRNNKAFIDGFKELHRDRVIENFWSIRLKRLRNYIVFHFNHDDVKSCLDTINLNTYVFATGHGIRARDIYFRLADEMIVHYVLDEPKDEEEYKRKFKELIENIVDFSKKFSDASWMLIRNALEDMGFHLN